jgi:hypothetical protein
MSKNRIYTGEVLRVSRGRGEESYTLRIVFYIAPKGVFPEVDKLEEQSELPIRLGNRVAYIYKSEHFYLIRVPGFASAEEANVFLTWAKAALMAFTLKQRISIIFVDLLEVDTSDGLKRFREQPGRLEMYGDWLPREDGTFTDGGVYPHFTTIIPEHLRIVEYPPPIYTERKSYLNDSQLLTEAFDEINANYNVEGIMNNERLLSALEIFKAAYAQFYRPLTYLNLVIVLEILAGNETPSSGFVVKVVEKFISVIRRMRAMYKMSDREKYDQLNDLMNSVSRLKKLSISAELRRYVYEAVNRRDPNMTKEESDGFVNLIYSVRSNLAHAGTVNHKKDTFPQQTYSETFGRLEATVPQALLYELNKYLKEGAKPLNISYLPNYNR